MKKRLESRWYHAPIQKKLAVMPFAKKNGAMALSGSDGARPDGATTGTVRHQVSSAGGDGVSDNLTIPLALKTCLQHGQTTKTVLFSLHNTKL